MSKRIGIAVIVLYLVFAFVLWEFNVHQWGNDTRLLFVVCAGLLSWLLLLHKWTVEGHSL